MTKLFSEYIKSYNLTEENAPEFFEAVGDLYYSPQVQSLRQYEQHFDIDRLQHVTSVAYLSYIIAKKLGWDYRIIARGSLLHDLNYYDWRDGTGEWHRPHGIKHPIFSAYNAIELNKEITDIEIEMIKCHMFPLTLRLPKHKEGYVLIFSDKYCANREVLYSFSKTYKKKFDKLIKG